jgi:galactose mutarotase-like enzyme
VFRLADNDETRAVYPFAFTLDAAFTLAGATLAMDVTVTNTGDREMPASFGFHPAFAWPLPFGRGKGDHVIDFEKEEPGELSAIVLGGWMDDHGWPSPLKGRRLELHDSLFERDALVWQGLASRKVSYHSRTGKSLEIAFDADTLGIWTKPGARFVCIEPWHGIADPHGFTGEIWDKPGILRFAPGEARTFSMQVTLAG